ncbi:hypothetical protein [Arthrobacter sp. NEB 688]|uniref:2'-5' RNA ligase family protein n=1 Tax=Arthrobacter sp. NEB 688 TaxID=904039 RepID=UPI001565C805|nr:hypothetical protein [Arthrobacter sp. NEB 688]QKE82749.1 hypothetical protein HL663_01465 [Arthrobacter sp. NEB 688]
MQLSVAVLPPDHVREAVTGIVARVPGAAQQLELTHAGAFRLRIIGLGNLTVPDARRLHEALYWPTRRFGLKARIRLSGVWALEDETDPSIALKVQGDVEHLAHIARNLPPLVADHAFYVDRRLFVPRLTVAKVTDATTVPVLEQVVEALGRYESPEWEVSSVQLLSRVHRDTGYSFEVFEDLPTSPEA